MHRRELLRLLGGGIGAALLTACGDRQGADSETATASAVSDPIARVAPEATASLSMLTASFEQLVGRRSFAFGLLGKDNKPVREADVSVWVVPEAGEPAGPFAATFHDVPDQPLGLYLAEVDIPSPGSVSFVAVTSDGRAGTDAVAVATPETSKLPAPGRLALAVATPTAADLLGYETLCTRTPACGMHEVSLDDALAARRPVVLLFSTPAYCQTAVCGPTVQVLDGVRTSGDWGDTAFIHCEIFQDQGETPGEPVREWELTSEPWLFTIRGDGRVDDRADGPVLTLASQVAGLVRAVSVGR